MATSSPTDGPYPHESGLTRGDKCHDTDDPSGILVVLERTGTVAANYELTGGISVANIHDDYPPHDEVIVVAYDRDLDTPGDHTRYYYPEGKLDLYAAGNWTRYADGVYCEHCGDAVPSEADWVEHVVTDCSANPA